ncbi:MAG: glycosyltransferase family 4 protein [Chloroflexota bacterium]|nr:glycosyltransferase family 4 protein [Chloroflexota bacterium]
MTAPRIQCLLLVTSDYHYLSGGKVHTTSAFMRFVPELLRLADAIVICAPVHRQAPAGAAGFSIVGPRISYVPLPPSRTLEGFLRGFPRDGLRTVLRLLAAIHGADLVWINGPHPLLPLSAGLCRVSRKPYLLWLRGDILATVRAKYGQRNARNLVATRTAWYLDRLIRYAARSAVVLYTGGGLRRYARSARYSQPAMTSLVQPGQLELEPRTEVHSPVRLLWAGQLRPVKGLLLLLAAVARLRDRGVEVSLTLVGDGEQREELERERMRLGLEDYARLTGYVAPGPDLERYFRGADLFVLPSLSEGVPKVLLEAMAHALPVIATRTGGIPDIVVDGVNGLLVPPGDAPAIETAIERLVQDHELRSKLSAGALDFAGQHTAAAEVGRIGEGLCAAFPELWGE